MMVKQTEFKGVDTVDLSVKMLRSKRDKLNTIAFLRNMSLTRFINDLADAEIAKSDDMLKAIAEATKGL